MKNSEEVVPAAPANELLSKTAQWWVEELQSWLQKLEKGEQEDPTGYGAYHRSRGLFENASNSLSGIPENDRKIEDLVIGQLEKAQALIPDGASRTSINKMLQSIANHRLSQ